MIGEETRTRFFAAIAKELPFERVVEVHLFGSIRQGGMESGLAVIAVDPHSPAPSVEGDAPARLSARRFTVYTSRYRHTLKGPDRGKWETSTTEEADAPLVTVDAVVRGVSRRSGEADETVRYSGDDFRTALSIPVVQT